MEVMVTVTGYLLVMTLVASFSSDSFQPTTQLLPRQAQPKASESGY